MPLSIDVILNNKVLGPAFRRHIEEGHQQGVQLGLQEGLKEGRKEGEVLMLRRFLESRFGPLPAQHALHLKGASEERLNTIADRALTAATLEEVFSES
jgi:flagellar biosynthesis/type III secretory pathway protein FliH